MSQQYASNQPQGFKNHVENVAIVGVSTVSNGRSTSCETAWLDDRMMDVESIFIGSALLFSLSFISLLIQGISGLCFCCNKVVHADKLNFMSRAHFARARITLPLRSILITTALHTTLHLIILFINRLLTN